MKKTILSLAVATVLAVSGCGSSEDEDAAKNLSASLQESNAEGDMIAVKKEEADCVANGMVDGIGTEKLQEYGLLNENNEVVENPDSVEMSKDDAETMVDSLFECTDVMGMMKKSMGEQSPAMQKCVEESLDEKTLRKAFVGVFSGNQEAATQDLMGPLMKCATEGMGSPSESPSTG